MRQASLQFGVEAHALTVAPSPFLEARETSALAAAQAAPFRGADNHRLLALVTAAGDAGMSDPEIQQATGWSRQTICLRRHDLKGFLVPSTRRALSPAGRSCVCWRRATVDEMTREAQA